MYIFIYFFATAFHKISLCLAEIDLLTFNVCSYDLFSAKSLPALQELLDRKLSQLQSKGDAASASQYLFTSVSVKGL